MKIDSTKAREYLLHCGALERLRLDTSPDTVPGSDLYATLRRIEIKAARLATAECNGDATPEGWEEKITAAVARVFGGKVPEGFFINGDPRGYTLKIRDTSPVLETVPGLSRDWGRYGILAPDFA